MAGKEKSEGVRELFSLTGGRKGRTGEGKWEGEKETREEKEEKRGQKIELEEKGITLRRDEGKSKDRRK